MSEEFEKLKNEITDIRQAAENKIELAKRAEEERIKKEDLILEKSGIRKLFEEIRQSGLVKARDKTTDELKNRKKLFRSYEENLEYLPAYIDSRRHYYKGVYVASLSLNFDYSGSGEDSRYKEVRVVVVGEELCLEEYCSAKRRVFSYTPIKEGELATIIAKAIKNPVRSDF